MSAPAEPTGAGAFHLGDNDEGGDFDSWTLGHLPDGRPGAPVESESALERCMCALVRAALLLYPLSVGDLHPKHTN